MRVWLPRQLLVWGDWLGLRLDIGEKFAEVIIRARFPSMNKTQLIDISVVTWQGMLSRRVFKLVIGDGTGVSLDLFASE